MDEVGKLLSQLSGFNIELPDVDWSICEPDTIDEHRDSMSLRAATFHRIHHLSPFFKQWHLVITKRHTNKINELKALRWKIGFMQRTYFQRWESKIEASKKLVHLRQLFCARRQFLNWFKYTDRKLLLEEQYDTLLQRKDRLYQLRGLDEWRRALRLKRLFYGYQRNEDVFFGRRIVKAFFIFTDKVKFERECTEMIQNNANDFLLSASFFRWRKILRLIRLTNFYTRRSLRRLKNNCFGRWRSQLHYKVTQRREVRLYVMKRRMKTLSNAFTKWNDKIETERRRIDIKSQAKENHAWHVTLRAWRTWKKSYALQSYLSTKEQLLTEAINDARLHRYFNSWCNNYNEHVRYIEMLEDVSYEMEIGALNRYFEKWKANFAIYANLRSESTKLNEILVKSALRRRFDLWRSEFIVRRKNRKAYRKAAKFRKLQLEAKAWNSIVEYIKHERVEALKIRCVEHVRGQHLAQKALCFWRRRALKYKRRRFLITSVLRQWAKNVQQRGFERWRMYIQYKHDHQREYEEAFERYNELVLAGVIRAFVKGAPMYIKEEEVAELESDEGCEMSMGKMNVSAVSTVLDRPKRPEFLTQREEERVCADLDDQITKLQMKLNKLTMEMRLCGSCPEKRAEMLGIIRTLNNLRKQKFI